MNRLVGEFVAIHVADDILNFEQRIVVENEFRVLRDVSRHVEFAAVGKRRVRILIALESGDGNSTHDTFHDTLLKHLIVVQRNGCPRHVESVVGRQRSLECSNQVGSHDTIAQANGGGIT